MYVESSLAPHVFNITYDKCFISCRFDFSPKLLFIGTYIQPESSPYFCASMFSDLSSLLLDACSRKLIPIIGGDINCRFGPLNDNFHNGLLYTDNVDTTSNFHGRTYGVDLCKTTGIFPVNHLQFKTQNFPGDFTYHKGNKKSQIDFVFTNHEGLEYIKRLHFPPDNWHLSDHRPIFVEADVPDIILPSTLLVRAKELNYEYDPEHFKPTRYLANYDTKVFETTLKEMFPEIEGLVCNELLNENIDGAISKLDQELAKVYRKSKIRFTTNDVTSHELMEKANDHYNDLRKCISGEIDADLDEMLQRYQTSRNLITKDICSKEHNKWKELTEDSDCKRLWKKISWKGDMGNNIVKSPVFEDLTLFFKKLYADGEDDIPKIEQLKSDVSVPELDNPITRKEMVEGLKTMKKGGFDHKNDIFDIIVNTLAPIILLLLNILFFVKYPVKLAISLLIALPKKGNLALPKNYRGIQMIPALAVLFDRIITKRLYPWIGVHDEQTAFQKLKSAIHHIFTIRLLTEIAKRTNTTLYIGFFDLEKAFDKVSRYKLLKKLVAMGIGFCMLEALKKLYICTYCILSFGRDSSKKFRTFSGIRQGASSSTLLFIAFIDGLVDYLKDRCPAEPMLELLHCLLHADDTAILSTDRELFINKCNYMLDYFEENSLSLNLEKSGYLIINGNDSDRVDLILKNGVLKYCPVVKYLGVKISDSGILKKDVEMFVEDKRANLTIKYGNFCRKNYLAPLDIKLRVINTCVSASLLYSCETWGDSQPKQIEVLYRQGLKTALGVRKCVNNEIVYTECGEFPLDVRIKKQQLKFWSTLQEYLQQNPNHYMHRLINLATNYPYISHYRNLEATHTDPSTCEKTLKETFITSRNQTIQETFRRDENSKLGTYFQINPTLEKPSFGDKMEFQRICISRYRTGSHNLAIEKGRMHGGTSREERLCPCNLDTQTIRHVLLVCPLLNELRDRYGIENVENGVMNDGFLIEMERVFGI